MQTRQSSNITQQILQSLSCSLQQAYQTLPTKQFQQIFQKAIIKCIKKSQVEEQTHIYSPYVTKWVQKYNGNLNLYTQALLLQLHCNLYDISANVLTMLNRIKHMVLDTNIQYLITKVFLYQAKYYQHEGDNQKAQKSLRKTIEYSEQYAMNFLKESDEVRKQIVDNIIISYFELFKLNKDQNLSSAVQYLSKAYNGAIKNYGNQNVVSRNLHQVLNHQILKKKSQSNLKASAVTVIKQMKIRKNKKLIVWYLWQDQMILAKLVDTRNQEESILSEQKVQVKLDKKKIQILRKLQFIEIKNTDIIIDQAELYQAVGVNKESQKRSYLKQIDRQQIIQKSYLTSSEEQSQQEEQIKNQFEPNPFDLFKNRERSKINSRTNSN